MRRVTTVVVLVVIAVVATLSTSLVASLATTWHDPAGFIPGGSWSASTDRGFGRARVRVRFPLDAPGPLPYGDVSVGMPGSSSLDRALPTWSWARRHVPKLESRGVSVTVTECAFGWPRVALSSVHSTSLDDLNNIRGEVIAGVETSRYRLLDGDGILPLRLIWSGFLTNTALWLALLCIAWWGPSLSRRRRRIRRGLCPDCGYPRAERSDRCPECGHTF